MVGRAALVALAVVASAGAAHAQPLRKVVINTVPTGATIYIGSKDEGPAGEAPLELELEPGTYTVIAEKDTYDPEFAELEVPRASGRGKKPVELTVQMKPAMARMRVEGAPEEATVKIDDNKALPLADYLDGFDVAAGAHTVLIELDGKTLAEEFIDVESGTEEVVTVGGRSKGGGGGGGGGDGDGDVTTAPDPATRRSGPIITVGPLFDFNWRRFTYQGSETDDTNLNMGQYGPLIGVALELEPFRLTGVRPLHRLAIVASAGRGFSQPVKADDPTTFADPVTTFWWRYQAGLRYRIPIGSAAIDLEGGYAVYYFQFNGDIADVRRLPDTTYQTVRVGARLGVKVGSVTPFVGGENRIVLSGGDLEVRYTTDTARGGSADTTGFGFRGGVEMALWKGKLAARLEGHYARFNWTFSGQMSSSMYIADGGIDEVYGVSTVVGYTY